MLPPDEIAEKMNVGIDALNDDQQSLAKLAEQMIFALESPKLLSEVAARGRIYAESVFSNTAIVDKLVKNCELIISKKI